jgi:hypothetical protein
MNWGKSVSRLETTRELLGFLSSNKKYWLLPIAVVMIVLGGMLVLAGGSAVAPFIYTLF